MFLEWKEKVHNGARVGRYLCEGDTKPDPSVAWRPLLIEAQLN